MTQPRPCILDADTGVDDALAIALAVNSPELDILAVTTLAGNTDIVNATRNTRSVLRWLGREDIPVHQGASRPLARPHRDAAYYHGTNGLGNAELPLGEHPLGPDRGPAAIIRHAIARPGEITLVCLGPLTNLAIALNVFPELANLLDRVVVMGGSFGKAGNVTRFAEFNTWADPEAAQQVFAASFHDARVAGLDATEQVAMDRAVWEKAAARPSPSGQLIGLVCRQAFVDRNQADFYLHDPFAVGLAIDPTLADTEPASITVTLEGAEEGKTTIAGPGPWRHATHPDRERFLALFEERTGLR